MTPLARLLVQRIRETGPITVADYMAECLLHPVHGYYTTRDPFGAAGDFTTAPEISQMFGELLGLALAQAWLDRGSPAPFTLAELGPGRGTLMADILRATRAVPGFQAAARIALVEVSPHLRQVQAATLSGHAPEWVDRIEDLPDRPLFLIANEFLDALPIRQFQHGPDGWQERLVGLRDGALTFGLSDPLPQVPDTPALRHAPEGALVEDNLTARIAVAEVSTRIARHGGVAYWIDYGGWRSQGDTLQALRQHKPDDPLAHPGKADLTAHVDFEPLAALAQAFAYDTQGAVLTRLGIDTRAERLSRNLTGAALESHRAAHRRLTAPTEMGSVFKMLAITSAGSPPPPGFA
ncbi:class I SAM-dependent methyltransferase [Tabrizicola sp.]|uniref:class I SAM-dependent methyltransferase n=1 Tax=Tabrizicola sp. TaxID=2005166 RepID=UPI002734BA87|nr:SAM-dependent methyltransferase [Tabrizicola sp.]MDP3197656.1 SAM-dependent methyltransferase [Tabrizicola sp.]